MYLDYSKFIVNCNICNILYISKNISNIYNYNVDLNLNLNNNNLDNKLSLFENNNMSYDNNFKDLVSNKHNSYENYVVYDNTILNINTSIKIMWKKEYYDINKKLSKKKTIFLLL